MGFREISLVLLLMAAAPLCAYDSSPVLSMDGALVAFVHTDEADGQPVIVVSSVEAPSGRIVARGISPSFNHDGTRLLYLVESPDKAAPAVWRKLQLGAAHTDIFVVNCDGTNMKQLTRQGGIHPVWSPEGKEIVYIDASGALCSLSSEGGLPKRITSKAPCLDNLTWLPDLKSFVATRNVKGKLARYAFTPPSTTPVRISEQYTVPPDVLAPTLSESGKKFGYFIRNSVDSDGRQSEMLEMWVSWGAGKRKVADIPLEAPLTQKDREKLSIFFSHDEKIAAAACAGKIWIVEFATGKTTLVSMPSTQPEPPDLCEPLECPEKADGMEADCSE